LRENGVICGVEAVEEGALFAVERTGVPCDASFSRGARGLVVADVDAAALVDVFGAKAFVVLSLMLTLELGSVVIFLRRTGMMMGIVGGGYAGVDVPRNAPGSNTNGVACAGVGSTGR
jgi:hypothetical protein